VPADNSSGSTTRIDPTKLSLFVTKPISDSATNGEAAIGWRKYGFHVIPIIPGTKQSAVKWDPWLADLSLESIARHWALYPEREVGMIVGDGLFVLDADTPESLTTILRFEEEFGVRALLINGTPKGGQHRFYRRAKGTRGKPDAHDSKTHPDRPDVRTGRSLIILPPANGRSILKCKARSVADLDEIGQDFIDAVARHNGRELTRQREPGNFPVIAFAPSSDVLRELEALLGCLAPDMGYADWVQVLMAVFHATGGDDEGLALVDAWSSRGRKYRGSKDLEAKWRSFRQDEPNPVTIATLRHMVDAAGYDWVEICAALGPQFEVCAYEIIALPVEGKATEVPGTRLDRYSLRGRTDELERMALDSVYVLGQLALLGDATVIYASPNVGKTLLMLYLLIEAIQSGRIDPARVYYLNMDDSHRGLLQKARIADEYGFHLLADGHQGFSAKDFAREIETMIANGQARGVVIFLDTAKHFTSLMDKVQASNFTKLARRFVMAGGTVIALAHANKNPGADGKPRYGGTSDVVDDFDTAWTISVVTARDEAGFKVVEFERLKSRGFVTQAAAYRYDATPHDSYLELLLSVEEVDPTQVATLRQAEQIRTDAEIVDAIKACILDGANTRMKLAKAVMQRAGASRRHVLKILDRYTGEVPGEHWWRFSTGARGSWVYELLDVPPSDTEVANLNL
jgi:hypothetical protein